MNQLTTPQELMARLNENEDAESALRIIGVAQNIIQRYEQAVDYGRRFLAQDLLASEEIAKKLPGGTYRWRRELDEEAWEEALVEESLLQQQVDTLEAAIEAGKQAQRMLTRLQQPYRRPIPGKTLYVRASEPSSEQ